MPAARLHRDEQLKIQSSPTATNIHVTASLQGEELLRLTQKPIQVGR
jgi:hypothetical protein